MFRVLEVILDVVALFVHLFPAGPVRFDVQSLGLEFFLLAGLTADHHRHVYPAHVVNDLLKPPLFEIVTGFLDTAEQDFNLLFPESLHLVVHLDGGKLVHRDDHALTQITSVREVIDDVPGNGFQPVIAFDHLDLAGEFFLQLGLLGFVKVLVFQDLVKLVTQILVLVPNLGHPFLVEKRHGGAFIHGLLEVVLADIVAKPGVGLALASQQRRPGKGQI